MMEYGFFGLLWESSLVIKVVFVVLIGMSLSSWSLILFKWWELSGASKDAAKVCEVVTGAATLLMATKSCGEDGCACKVVKAGGAELKRLKDTGLVTLDQGRLVLDSVRHALKNAVEVETERLYGSLSYLSTCAATAPLLGLFGTVWGIMSSFASITGGTGGVAEVAPGLAEALGTTAAGLMVAIPAVLAYNLYLKMLADTEGELNTLSDEFMNRVKGELVEIVAVKPLDSEA